jgi:hypothetical protein
LVLTGTKGGTVDVEKEFRKWRVNKVRKKIAIILLFLLALCITECSPKRQIIKEDEEGILKRRVQEYWGYKIKGEWDKCYQYESPDLRKNFNIVGYVSKNSRSVVKWEGFEIENLWTSGDEGNVKVKIRYRYIIPETRKVTFERVVEEKWCKKDGKWYRLSPPI